MSRVRKIPKPKLDQPEAPEGKIVDFIDGKLRADSETEQVRQDFERTLIEEYRYERADIGVDGVLGNPDNEYIRYWIMANCQVLASVDLPVETFLPRTGTQTSVLILRRKSEQEKLAESLSGEAGDYQIFMAIANSVGKDRRGNMTYVRDQDGREVLRPELYENYRSSTILDFQSIVETNGRVVADELPRIAELYREFMTNTSGSATAIVLRRVEIQLPQRLRLLPRWLKRGSRVAILNRNGGAEAGGTFREENRERAPPRHRHRH